MSTTDMTREAWLDRRRAGIGGSDVAALLGLSRWKTPLDVFLDKTGRSEPIPDNEPMLWPPPPSGTCDRS